MSGRERVPIAIVQHANQFLIADGYDEREGIGELADGYAVTLQAHQDSGVPLNLHVSGTLIEALAWHAPWLLEMIAGLVSDGIVSLIGGAYAQPVMPLFATDLNVRQLREQLELYRAHFGADAGSIEVAWIPERVWDTRRLAPALTDPSLPNGGYRWVLLDDRTLLSASHGDRARFDAANTFVNDDGESLDGSIGWTESADPYRICAIADGRGLGAVPISVGMRYWAPPRTPGNRTSIERLVSHLAREGDDQTILVYADDLEKSAGVAAWDVRHVGEYARFVRWLADAPGVEPVALPRWLAGRVPTSERPIEAGTFFELAKQWGAGEQYLGWWASPAWTPYRASFEAAEQSVRALARDVPQSGLLDAAWKHLMASTYETAWHDQKTGAPAPWARAVASHARDCLTITAAARRLAGNAVARAEVRDLDGDGNEEAVIGNRHVVAVLSPRWGGRITSMYGRTATGEAMLVGNPGDDWNWQEGLHRHMDQPANHPGALGEAAFEHDRYVVTRAGRVSDGAVVELTNVEPGSVLAGATRRLFLGDGSDSIEVCVRWPEGLTGLGVDFCLSPDYPALLRHGRHALWHLETRSTRGVRSPNASILVARAQDEDTFWADPSAEDTSHGVTVRLRSNTSHFHVAIGATPERAHFWCAEELTETVASQRFR